MISDPSSLFFLLLGKDHPWLPVFLLGMLLVQKWATLKEFYKNTTIFGKSQYTLTTHIYTNIQDNYTYGHISDSIWALIYYIDTQMRKNTIPTSNVISFTFPSNLILGSESKDMPILPSNNTSIQLTPSVSCRVYIENETKSVYTTNPESSQRSNSIDITKLTFTLSTHKHMDHLFAFLEEIAATYTKKEAYINNKDLRIYKPTYKTGMPSSFDSIAFQSSKSFDNLFFSQKDTLLKRLTMFVHREKYKCLGLPETLGLLFYGEPGTGKTSCIKAVANYLNMHMIIVPMHQIRSKKRLEDLFFGYTLSIPQEKRLYVFEEIDCNGWEKLICPRCSSNKLTNIESTESSSDAAALTQIATTLLQEKGRKELKEEEEDLTLGAILEVIDGIRECPGRVIIMTTNHPENLDPALKRPGRIDMEIEFTKLQKEHISEIYKKWYGSDILDSDLEKVPNGVFTQAEISQKLFKHETSPSDFLAELMVEKIETC